MNLFHSLFLVSYFSYFYFFSFSLLSYEVAALNRIWLIRHCDKPKNPENPCCSEMGYRRANSWYQYFQLWLKPENIVKIVTSEFNKKKVCISGITTGSNSQCQKSQRMWITGFYIYSHLQTNMSIQIQSIINTRYCIGQYKEMLENIMEKNADDSTDAIIVWEHNEIIDIIRHFGIKIDNWKNEKIYDIVFLLDVKKRTLYYDCFSLEKEKEKEKEKRKEKDISMECSDKWLKHIKKIPDYYKEKEKDKEKNHLFLQSDTIHHYSFEIKAFIGVILFSILFYVSCYVCFCHPYPTPQYGFLVKNNHHYIEI
jgi:hypothetical protein